MTEDPTHRALTNIYVQLEAHLRGQRPLTDRELTDLKRNRERLEWKRHLGEKGPLVSIHFHTLTPSRTRRDTHPGECEYCATPTGSDAQRFCNQTCHDWWHQQPRHTPIPKEPT